MYIYRLLVFLYLAFNSTPSMTAHASSSQEMPLLLISLDGFMPAYVHDKRYQDLPLPHLRAFLREGTFAESVTNVLPSLTYPAHTTILTGVSPSQHGIYNNVFLDPKLANTDTWYWFASDIQSKTLWDVAAASHLRTVNVDWPVSVGAPVTINMPQYWRDDVTLDHRYWLGMADGARDYIRDAEKRLGTYPLNRWDLASDRKRGDYIKDIIARFKPQFLTAYLSSVDETSHHQGLNSQELREAILGVDQIIGDIDSQAKLTYPQGYRLAIVSDHGFAMAEKEIHLNALLHELGLITINEQGKVDDWKAIAWHAEGVAAIILKDPKDLAVLGKIQSGLNSLAATHPDAIEKILNKHEIDKFKGFPEASLLVAAKEHYKFTWSPKPPIVGAPAKYPATHGFLPDDRKMDALFMIKGKGIKAGKNLGRIQLVDIAPSLAPLLGGRLDKSEGQDLLALPSRRSH